MIPDPLLTVFELVFKVLFASENKLLSDIVRLEPKQVEIDPSVAFTETTDVDVTAILVKVATPLDNVLVVVPDSPLATTAPAQAALS